MAILTITIDTANADFAGQPEYAVADILEGIADGIRNGSIDDDRPIRDINGNTVGHLTVGDDGE